MKLQNKKDRRFSMSWLGGVCVALIALVFLLLLNRLALFSSQYAAFNVPIHEGLILTNEAFLPNLIWPVLMGAVLYGVMALILRKNPQERVQRLILICTVWMLAAGSLWLWQQKGVPISEPEGMYLDALAVVQGNPEILISEYYWMFPHQYSLILFFAGLLKISGTTGFQIIQLTNIFSIAAITCFGALLLEKTVRKPMVSALYLALCVTCLPLLFYVPFIYGDVIATGAVLAAYYCGVRLTDTGRFRWLWGVAAASLAAMMARKNSMIAMLALAAVLLVYAISHRTHRYCVLAGAALAVAMMLLVPWGSIRFAEHLMGQEAGPGTPPTAHCVMGLTDAPGSLGPGWYNGYVNNVCTDNDFDIERVRDAALEEMTARIGALAADPAAAKDFFVRKTQSQWCEPTFQGLAMNNFWAGEQTGLAKLVYQNEAVYYKTLALADRYQSLIYLAAALGTAAMLWNMLRHKADVLLCCIPLVNFIGGFLFHLVWEAKPRYCLPYFIMLLPYAAYGIWQAAQWVRHAARRLHRESIDAERIN